MVEVKLILPQGTIFSFVGAFKPNKTKLEITCSKLIF